VLFDASLFVTEVLLRVPGSVSQLPCTVDAKIVEEWCMA
jgi:hypothetical protein